LLLRLRLPDGAVQLPMSATWSKPVGQTAPVRPRSSQAVIAGAAIFFMQIAADEALYEAKRDGRDRIMVRHLDAE